MSVSRVAGWDVLPGALLRVLLVGGCLLGVHVMPGLARACSPNSCVSARVSPAGGALPANQLTFDFWLGRDSRAGAFSSLPRLVRVDGERRTELAVEMSQRPGGNLILRAGELLPGTKLVLESDATGCVPAFRSEYTVTEVHPLPTALGTLAAVTSVDELEVFTTAGTCTEQVEAAYADLTVVLSKEAQPFADGLSFAVVIDGQARPHPSTKLADRAGLTFRVFAVCEPNIHVFPDLSLGKHQVRMRASLPDGTAVETPDMALTLDCAPAADGCSLRSAGTQGALPWSAAALLWGALRRRRGRVL